MTLVSVDLTDEQWRVRCELLATEELELAVKEGELKAEAEEWKDRKKDLETGINATKATILKFAKEVDTRKEWTESQQELDMGADGQPETRTAAGEEG